MQSVCLIVLSSRWNTILRSNGLKKSVWSINIVLVAKVVVETRRYVAKNINIRNSTLTLPSLNSLFSLIMYFLYFRAVTTVGLNCCNLQLQLTSVVDHWTICSVYLQRKISNDQKGRICFIRIPVASFTVSEVVDLVFL